MSEVVCIGQACIDFFINGIQDNFDLNNMRNTCESFTMEIGGDSTNESRILKRMGVDVSVVHSRGDDSPGAVVKYMFDLDGVDISKCIVSPDAKTSIVIIFPMKEKERHVIVPEHFGDRVSFDVTADMIKGAKIVSFASLLGQPFREPEQTYNAAKLVKDNGAILCCDINLNPTIDIRDYREAFQFVDYFFPNHEEALGLSHLDTVEQAADFFLDFGVKNMIIKTGSNGVYVKNATEEFRLPAFHIEQVIDTTGAGDNFAAGFICAMLEGKSLKECLLYATATSSICIQVIGASTGVRSKQQVIDAIMNQKVHYPEIYDAFFRN
ncbi:MAG: sugar kinase [Oscillospiraceae bacterium]|nr:sugar kinase [Oscillospiraceae bacterium]